MKVTRLKQGYTIRLSDAELGMLQWLMIDGLASEEGLEDYELRQNWTPAEKAAFTRRVKQVGGDEYRILSTDEDRR